MVNFTLKDLARLRAGAASEKDRQIVDRLADGLFVRIAKPKRKEPPCYFRRGVVSKLPAVEE